MTFMPTLIAGRFEDVIEQYPPAAPLYAEHPFVAWRSPLRGEADGTRRASNAMVAPTANRPGNPSRLWER